MDTRAIIELEQDYLLQVYARADFVLDQGYGCTVVDTEGREYLDCVAGIAVNALGYGDPDLLAALHQQAGKLWHVSNLYHTEPQARLAQLLCETSFADRVYFANCGASANESAFKFARRYARERARSETGPSGGRGARERARSETGPSGGARSETGPSGEARSETGPSGGRGARERARSETGPSGGARSETGPSGEARSETGPSGGARSETGPSGGRESGLSGEKYHIVAFSGGFHGRLFGSLAATDRPKYQQPFEPLMPGVRFAPFNDLDAAAAAIQDDVCAVIVEPIQGEGGVHPATREFLAGLRTLCDQRGALLIFDEVQCGLGRSGTLWAYQGYGVQPDMLTAAKPLAGGLPMGAVLMTQRVADAIHPFDHASTFAGGPLVSAVAAALVQKVSQPAFLAAVRENGEYLRERLAELNSPHLLDVRGQGLLVGLELDIPAADVVKAGYRHGLLLVGAGPNVLRLAPPLIISRAEIDQVVERLSAVIGDR
jgi:acetylornithine/succinyldiaminopimelate/putrescine aminotransferase